MLTATDALQKSEAMPDSLADIIAILPFWEKYREQLIAAELKNASSKFPLTQTEQDHLDNYQKQIGHFFKNFNSAPSQSKVCHYFIVK